MEKFPEIIEVFTKEDIEFNKKMMDISRELPNVPIKTQFEKDRNYDFISEILNEFRRKWGIETE